MKGQLKAELSSIVLTAIPSWKAWKLGIYQKNVIYILVAFIWFFLVIYWIVREIERTNKMVFDTVVDYQGRQHNISWRSDFENTHLHCYRVWCTVTKITDNIWGDRKPIKELEEVKFYDVWWKFEGRYITGNKTKNEIAYVIRRDNRSLKGRSISILLIHFTGDQQRI